MYPLKLKSVLKDIIWGGTLLSEQYNKGDAGQKIAEAWVLALRPDGENIIENGEYKGKKLSEVINCDDHFPLLIKLIDACDKLSVQVHPDDAFAKKEGLDAGKTEMWYILDAKPGAKLVYGLRKDIEITSTMIKEYAEKGTLEELLNYVSVKKGDVFFIPAGLVHAIGEGILIAEVQQNSNTTYRLYDYERKDKNGNKRELHIDKAIQVIDPSLPHFDSVSKVISESDGVKHTLLSKCEYFSAEEYVVSTKTTILNEKDTFLLCTDGNGEIIYNDNTYHFEKGDGYYITSDINNYTIISDECSLILSRS